MCTIAIVRGSHKTDFHKYLLKNTKKSIKCYKNSRCIQVSEVTHSPREPKGIYYKIRSDCIEKKIKK